MLEDKTDTIAATRPRAERRKQVRVLAIDGGGVRGLIAALILDRLHERLEAKRARKAEPPTFLAHHFDLIAGTSTGALIAIGLAAAAKAGSDLPLLQTKDLVALYRDRADSLFMRRRWPQVQRLLGAMQDDARLERILESMLGDRLLSDTIASVLIPAYDIERRTVKIFKNRQPATGTPEKADYRLRDVARAATAAPTLFRPARVKPVGSDEAEALIDGGVFANNPALCGYMEARNIFGEDADILVVSIGTGDPHRSYSIERARRWGLVGWLDPRLQSPLLSVMFDGQADNVDHHLAGLLGRGHNYFRLDPRLAKSLNVLDDARRTTIEALSRVTDRYLEDQSSDLDAVAERLTNVTA